MLAAAPAWFADNLAGISFGTLAVLVLLVLRVVQKTIMRVALLAVIVVAGVVIYANRAPLEVCAKTCSCSLGGRQVTLPLCGKELNY